MRVRDVMVPNVSLCNDTDPIDKCARLMRDEKIGLVPVINGGGRVVGVITDRDITLRAVAGNLSADTRVREIMSRGPVITVGPDDELVELESRMAKGRKGRAVVIDRLGRCVGVVSFSDIAMREEPSRTAMLFREVTRRDVPLNTRRGA